VLDKPFVGDDHVGHAGAFFLCSKLMGEGFLEFDYTGLKFVGIFREQLFALFFEDVGVDELSTLKVVFLFHFLNLLIEPHESGDRISVLVHQIVYKFDATVVDQYLWNSHYLSDLGSGGEGSDHG